MLQFCTMNNTPLLNHFTTALITVIIISGMLACKEPTPNGLAVKPVKEVILDSLAHPWSMAFISEQEAIISEKDGELVRVDLTSKGKYPIKGFPDDLFQPILIEPDKYPPGYIPD